MNPSRFLLVDPESCTVTECCGVLDQEMLSTTIGGSAFVTRTLPDDHLLWFRADQPWFLRDLNVAVIAGIDVAGSPAVITGSRDVGGSPTDCLLDRDAACAAIQWRQQRMLVGEEFVQTAAGGYVARVYHPPLAVGDVR